MIFAVAVGMAVGAKPSAGASARLVVVGLATITDETRNGTSMSRLRDGAFLLTVRVALRLDQHLRRATESHRSRPRLVVDGTSRNVDRRGLQDQWFRDSSRPASS